MREGKEGTGEEHKWKAMKKKKKKTEIKNEDRGDATEDESDRRRDQAQSRITDQ